MPELSGDHKKQLHPTTISQVIEERERNKSLYFSSHQM